MDEEVTLVLLVTSGIGKIIVPSKYCKYLSQSYLCSSGVFCIQGGFHLLASRNWETVL